MSESLAAFRNNRSHELRRLAEEHFQHDLTQSDRDTMRSAASKVSTHTQIGSLLGLGLGIYLAVRLRSARAAYFKAFRAMEKPVEVKFADGRTEPLPDLTKFVQPSPIGDAATYFFFGLGGLFLGGETGLLTGTVSASRTITRDPQTKARIERAFKNYRIDAMKKEIEAMEGTQEPTDVFS